MDRRTDERKRREDAIADHATTITQQREDEVVAALEAKFGKEAHEFNAQDVYELGVSK